MQVEVSKKLLDKLVNDYAKNVADDYVIRVYFTGEDGIDDSGREDRVNIEISGSIWDPGNVKAIWFG